MKVRKAAGMVGLALAAIALLVPTTANANELWWFDHREGRFAVATSKKVVEPVFNNLWLATKAGKKFGPCKGVKLEGEVHNKFGGMGEGTLNKPVGAAEECGTTVGNCIVHWLEPSLEPSWKLTLKTTKKVEITNLGITVEKTGECEGIALPEEFSVSGTVEGTWEDFGEGEYGSAVKFDKVKVMSGGVELFLEGALIFGTEVTAKTEPSGFTPTSSPALIDGKQTTQLVLTRTGRPVVCEQATFAGTAKEGATTLTLTPTLGNCSTTVLGTKFPVTIKVNSCDYLLHLEADLVDEEKEIWTYTAPTDLKCPAGKEMEVDVYMNHTNHTAGVVMCRYNLGESGNQGLEQIELTQGIVDEAKGKPKSWIETHVDIGGIDSKRTIGSAFACGAENDTAGTLKGVVELQGTTEEGEIPNGIAVFP